ncbi:MAG: four helix bundle protein [Gemmatimonadota bacterium]
MSHTSIADPMRRAASSVVPDTAEGASELSRKGKMRFYRMARRSAAKTAAALDVLVAGHVRTRQRVATAASAAGTEP